MLNFNTDIRYLKGVGEKRAEYLGNMGIDTVGALLRYFPRDYEDFGNINKIFNCELYKTVCIKGKITSDITEHYIRKNMTIYKFSVFDGTAHCQVTIFNNKYLAAKLHKGSEYLFLGKIGLDRFGFNMSSPQIRETGYAGITPVYKASAKITSAAIEKLVRTALANVEIGEILPDSVKKANNLTNIREAIENIHFPKNTLTSSEQAKKKP